MTDPLATYVHDHLAGARFAISLLDDLSKQDQDVRIQRFAQQLRPEIEADVSDLQQLADRLGDPGNAMKEAAAWIAQKASRVKLATHDALGGFESIEMLCVGILGKLALWKALQTLLPDSRLESLDLAKLAKRAIQQHAEAETLRLELAASALRETNPEK
jgi:hypothetical protein